MIIAVNTPASGLDIFLRFQGVLTDPLSITYQIFEPANTIVGSGSGFRRSVGHYDARNTTIPSGFDTTSPWKITWTYKSPAGVTGTATEQFTVVDSLVSSFSNISNITSLVKLDLNLTSADFTESEFSQFVQKAVFRINRRLCLTGTADELSFDQGTGTVIPTPNSTIFDFLIMQIECFIVKQIRKVAVGKGIRVKDGETEIDTTASFGGFSEQVKDICGELDDAVKEFFRKDHENTYKTAAVKAGSVVWYGNKNICESLDHNGQGFGHERCIISPFENSFGHIITTM